MTPEPIDKVKVAEIIEEIRPHLQADGGDIHLVDVTDDGYVQVELSGACVGCPMADMTLKMGVESKLREQIPQIQGVIAA